MMISAAAAAAEVYISTAGDLQKKVTRQRWIDLAIC
jgi:hypothetical protein